MNEIKEFFNKFETDDPPNYTESDWYLADGKTPGTQFIFDKIKSYIPYLRQLDNPQLNKKLTDLYDVLTNLEVSYRDQIAGAPRTDNAIKQNQRSEYRNQLKNKFRELVREVRDLLNDNPTSGGYRNHQTIRHSHWRRSLPSRRRTYRTY